MRRLRAVAGGAVLGLLFGTAVVVVAPLAFGWQTMTVMSGSMTPALLTGDAVVARPVRPTTLHVGDVVTFRDPDRGDRLVTHRVRAVRPAGTAMEVTTQGDANPASETWRVPRDGSVGRVVLRLPRIGFVLAPASSAAGRVALLAVPAVLLGGLSLVSLWRPSREAANVLP